MVETEIVILRIDESIRGFNGLGINKEDFMNLLKEKIISTDIDMVCRLLIQLTGMITFE